MATTIEAQWMQDRTYSAREDRAIIAALFDEGVLDLTAFEVTESGTPAMSVAVSTGKAVVKGDDQSNQNNYLVEADSIDDVTITTADPTNPRIDLVVLQIDDGDAGHSPGNDDAAIDVIAGTPAGSPSPPSLPNSALLLAHVAVAAGATSIQNSNITDMRAIAGRKDAPGVMQLYSGPTTQIPSGWLLCDGTAYSRTTYAALNAAYSAQAYPFGNGDGSTTFNVPDMRDRVAVAKGTVKTTQGATGGGVDQTLATTNLPNHNHSMGHTHTLAHTHSFSATSGAAGGHSHSHSFYVGTGGAHTHSVKYDGGPLPGTGSDALYYVADSTAYQGWLSDGFLSSTGSHSHSISGSITSVGNHSHSVSGTTGGASTTTTSAPSNSNTGTTGSGTAFNIEQPYIVINGWIVRT